MSTQSQTTWTTIQAAAQRGGANWRIGIVWIFATLIPTAILSVPVGRVLAERLDHSMFAAEWARELNLSAMVELILNSNQFTQALTGAFAVSALLTILLWPFLTAMIVSTAGEPRRVGFVALLQGGARGYGRMLRMLLWSVVPFGIAGGIGGGALYLANKMGETAILESTGDHEQAAALTLLIVLLILAHISVEAGRAQLALDSARRSAVKAWWRGLRLFRSRPWDTFASYAGLTVAGLMLIALIGWLRINLPHSNLPGIVFALLLTQLIVIAAVWMRTSRLFAMVQISAYLQGGSPRNN